MMLDVGAVADEFEALWARLRQVDDPATADLIEAMRTTLEELRVADEELSRQNEELASLQLAVADEAARYRALFDLAPVACVTTNRFAVIAEANEATAALLEVDRRFLTGKPLPLYVDEAGRRELRATALRLTGTTDGAVASLNVRMRRRSGVAFDALVTARATGDAVQWILQDVTEDRQAEQRLWELNTELETRVYEQAYELEAILQQLPVGVLVVEADTFRVRRSNHRAREILGEALKVGATDSFDRFERYHPDGRPLGVEAWPVRNALAGEIVVREPLVFVLPDGRHPTIEMSAVPSRADDGTVAAAVVMFDDVTEREARERAEREFVTNAAHELRTPLTAIATAVEVLQSGAKEIPEERDLFLGHVERECRRLARLGTALLSLARAQAQQEAPPTEVLPLREILHRIAADLHVGDEVAVNVTCDPEVAALANRELVEQALWNVAANAARYTLRGEVALTAALDDGRAVVVVRDTGPGIRPEARSRLFERFYRAGARDGAGFGLGLAIAKQSIEAVGGTLTIDSEGEDGTTARLLLPPAKLL